MQNRAIAAKRDALLKKGWGEVEVLEIGQRFDEYDHAKVPKAKGGKVFLTVSHDGEVTVYDGYLSRKEVNRLVKAQEREARGKDAKGAVPHPAITKAMQNYLDLHRHAVVRLALIAKPEVAWRLAVAHMIAASGNWAVKRDPQTSRSPAIRDSIARSAAQATFEIEGREIARLLGKTRTTTGMFAILLELDDATVQRIAAFFMAASVQAGSDVVEDVGVKLQVDPHQTWQPDDTFFDLIRDRVSINAMLAEVAGDTIAKSNIAEKAKTQKQIVRDCLTGTNGRVKVEGWLPGWMAFPTHPIGQGLVASASVAEMVGEPERIAAE